VFVREVFMIGEDVYNC